MLSPFKFMNVAERLYPDIYHFLIGFISTDDAVGITANVFIKLHKTKKVFLTIDRIKRWVLCEARILCQQKLKNREYVMEVDPELIQRLLTKEPDWLDHVEQRKRRRSYLKLVQQVIDSVPKEKRKICDLMVIGGLKDDEIVERLHVTEEEVVSVRTHIKNFTRR